MGKFESWVLWIEIVVTCALCVAVIVRVATHV